LHTLLLRPALLSGRHALNSLWSLRALLLRLLALRARLGRALRLLGGGLCGRSSRRGGRRIIGAHHRGEIEGFHLRGLIPGVLTGRALEGTAFFPQQLAGELEVGCAARTGDPHSLTAYTNVILL